MSLRRVAQHIVVWVGVFVFWLVATRQYHPTLTIAVSATAVLVSALAVYANTLMLVLGFARRRSWWRYTASLLATVIVLDLVAVPLIRFIYDWMWGPDPLRFGFWFNVVSDGIIIVAHVMAAMLVVWVVRFFRPGSPRQPNAF